MQLQITVVGLFLLFATGIAANPTTPNAASQVSNDAIDAKEKTAESPGPLYTAPPAQKGVALGLFRQEPNWNYSDFIVEIKQLGASHVAIVVSNYMKTNLHDEIYDLKGYTTPMPTVEKTIRQVQKNGMQVFLFPILRVEDKSNGGWRGTLAPANPDTFFANYINYIIRYAKVAEKYHVPLMSIGSELGSMDVLTDKWRDIIMEVRKVYQGKLTYSANWDHYEKVEFFDELDYLGVTGYFQLADHRLPFENNPPVESLVHSWREIYFKLMRWQHKWQKPLIFTEVGYLSQKGAAAQPWAEGANEKVDLEIQRRCYEAFIRVWDGEDRVAGAYFWNWFDWEGENDREYTPREKPAASEMENWFSAAAQTEPSSQESSSPPSKVRAGR
ncbi:MAG: hypothetical protein JXX14_12660 [Deltaproteobacteria bacterium]|nr:hypothetical protein [Deltaproteobacteria bacterium]